MQRDQQAYDRGTTIFSPDGRLYQVEYAREAVARGAPTVGVTTGEGVALAAETRRRSPLEVADGIEKLHRVDDGLVAGSAGHVADARHLVDLARRFVQAERLRYGEPPATGTTARAVADELQEATATGGRRPFGVALLLAGVRDGDDGPRLYETDPSGTTREWRAAAVGRDAADVRGLLADDYREGLSLDAGIHLALRGLAAASDPDDGSDRDRTFTPADVSVTTVTADGVRSLGADDRAAALDAAGTLAS
jgi:proteasome alpha subunit